MSKDESHQSLTLATQFLIIACILCKFACCACKKRSKKVATVCSRKKERNEDDEYRTATNIQEISLVDGSNSLKLLTSNLYENNGEKKSAFSKILNNSLKFARKKFSSASSKFRKIKIKDNCHRKQHSSISSQICMPIIDRCPKPGLYSTNLSAIAKSNQERRINIADDNKFNSRSDRNIRNAIDPLLSKNTEKIIQAAKSVKKIVYNDANPSLPLVFELLQLENKSVNVGEDGMEFIDAEGDDMSCFRSKLDMKKGFKQLFVQERFHSRFILIIIRKVFDSFLYS